MLIYVRINNIHETTKEKYLNYLLPLSKSLKSASREHFTILWGRRGGFVRSSETKQL